MNEKLLKHFKESGRFTYAGLYAPYFKTLPDDITELGNLVRAQIIHRITLKQGNSGANADLRYGDMTRYPWHRMRCRAGYAPYIVNGISMDHWINQYYDEALGKWITIDADGFFKKGELPFDSQYDIPQEQFDFAGPTWLDIRQGKKDGSKFIYADGLGTNSLKALSLYVFYDLNALMNQELTFSFAPLWWSHFDKMTEEELAKIDLVAELLKEPDENFDELREIWSEDKFWRLFCSPLVGESDFI